MSLRKQNTILPDTRRNFEQNNLVYISGAFLFVKGFKINYSDVTDLTIWQAALKNKNIVPLHYLLQKENNDVETVYTTSEQDFTYKSKPAKYRHKLNYNFDLTKHIELYGLVGSDYDVVYYDANRNFYFTTTDNKTTVKGFTSNRVEIEPLALATESNPSFTIVDVELNNVNELNLNGVIVQIPFNPRAIDRLFASITILYIDDDTINFTATYGGVDINDIEKNGVSVNDRLNGSLSFDQFNYLSGVYRLTNFSKSATSGTLTIISDLYIACINYTNVIGEAPEVVNYDFEDTAGNFTFENGTNYDFN